VQASDPSQFGARRFDAVLAVDSMPYVVQGGCAEKLWAQVANVLSAGGVWLILNNSCRGSIDRDRCDVATLAARFGLLVDRNGTQDFHLWDAHAFLLRRQG
jgi:hypothetical protein